MLTNKLWHTVKINGSIQLYYDVKTLEYRIRSATIIIHKK